MSQILVKNKRSRKLAKLGVLLVVVPLALGRMSGLTQAGGIKPAPKVKTVNVQETEPHAAAAHWEIGKLRYLEDFSEVWVAGVHYDLRERPRIRLCIKYLVKHGAFTRRRARHLVTGIDKYVCQHGPYLRSADIKIDHYFKDHTGKFQTLRKALIHAAGRNRKYYLAVF